MTSKSKIEANQRNAARSTGPRTPMGKAIARKNSWRHGLAASISKDPVWSYEVRKLATVFVPKEAGPDVDQAIRTSLTAMMEVMRVHAAREELWKVALARQSVCRRTTAPDPGGSGNGSDAGILFDSEALAAMEVLPQLLRLERYQRRAEAYCWRIIREFGEADCSFVSTIDERTN